MLKILRRLIILTSVSLAAMFFIFAIIQPHQQTAKRKELPMLRESGNADLISAVGCLIAGGSSCVLLTTFEKKGGSNE